MRRVGDIGKKSLMATRPAPVVMAATLAPWVLVDMGLSEVHAALLLVAFTLLMVGVGSLILALIRSPTGGAEKLLLTPALGLLVSGAAVSIGVRVGMTPTALLWVIAIVGIFGLAVFLKTKAAGEAEGVPAGLAVSLLAVLACIVYFLPGAARDAMLTGEGGYRWMYVDTQYMMAVSASIKESAGLPLNPGLATETLNYHYAPFALAASLSAGTGIELGDALVRVVRAATQHALLCAAIAFGVILGAYVKAARTGGLAAAAGLFFYGSVAALFATFQNSTSNVSDALLFNLPWVNGVLTSGGPFSHLVLGHSVMHGMTGMVAILAILLMKAKNARHATYSPDAFYILPGLLAVWHSMAGLGATGIVAAVTLFYGYRKPAGWISALLTLGALVVVFYSMGFLDYPSTSTMTLDTELSAQLFFVFVWFYVGLGIRVIALRWIKNLGENPAGMILLLAFLGYGSVTVFIFDSFDSHDWYGFKFLQAIVSLFAFVMLAGYFERGEGWRKPFIDTVRIVFWSALGFLVLALALRLVEVSTESVPGEGDIDYVVLTIISAALATAGTASVLIAHRRLPVLGHAALMLVAGVYFLGFFAWVTPWVNYGLGRGGMEIVLSSDEVKVLRMIRAESEPTDVLATNRHAWDSFRSKKERSYAYRAVSERPVLIEGWHNGEVYLPSFAGVKSDNEIIFEGSDPQIVRDIIDHYGVKYLIAKPGTDLRITGQDVQWLERMQGTGSLTAYRVVE